MYPKAIKTRAVIHQRLFHDSSEFYVRILDIANLAFSSSVNPVITIQHRDNLRKALNVLEVIECLSKFSKLSEILLQNFLEGYEYFAGHEITIADLSYLASMSTLIVRIQFKVSTLWIFGFLFKHFGFNISPWTNVNNWYRRMRDIPGFQECDEGAREFGAIVKAKLKISFENL